MNWRTQSYCNLAINPIRWHACNRTEWRAPAHGNTGRYQKGAGANWLVCWHGGHALQGPQERAALCGPDRPECVSWKVHSAVSVTEPGNTHWSKIVKLDANLKFWQIQLTEESGKYITVITCFGRFHLNRLPFGITSVPDHFQCRMAKVTGNWMWFAISMTPWCGGETRKSITLNFIQWYTDWKKQVYL